jgi:hypothetical protein
MRVDGGVASVTPVGASLQGLVRANPEALLGRKVLVGEGKTEVGLARACDTHWNREGQEPFAYLGVVPANGGGNTVAPGIAIKLANLGYEAALVVDSDEPIQPARAKCESHGVRVVQWEGGVSTEERVCMDVPLETLQEILDAALRHPESDVQGELACIASRLGIPRLTTQVVADWIAGGSSEDSVRLAIGSAAKKRSWFKRIDLGEELGGMALGALHMVPQSELGKQLAEIKAWLYA